MLPVVVVPRFVLSSSFKEFGRGTIVFMTVLLWVGRQVRKGAEGGIRNFFFRWSLKGGARKVMFAMLSSER